MATDNMCPTDITPEEKAAGFGLTEIPNPKPYAGEPKTIQAAVRPLPGGRIAVKRFRPPNKVGYSIEDAKTHELVDSCATFGELMTRYPTTA